MRHDDYNTHNRQNGQNGQNGGALHDDVGSDDDVYVEHLREEVRRYEQDLRELADA
jgi:hypothetical protein